MSPSRPSGEGPSPLLRQLSLPAEVHLRRMRVSDALDRLERYLNDAATVRMPRARIIHGKGTGVLKRAVVDYLSNHRLVARHYPALPHEGNGGVARVAA